MTNSTKLLLIAGLAVFASVSAHADEPALKPGSPFCASLAATSLMRYAGFEDVARSFARKDAPKEMAALREMLVNFGPNEEAGLDEAEKNHEPPKQEILDEVSRVLDYGMRRSFAGKFPFQPFYDSESAGKDYFAYHSHDYGPHTVMLEIQSGKRKLSVCTRNDVQLDNDFFEVQVTACSNVDMKTGETTADIFFDVMDRRDGKYVVLGKFPDGNVSKPDLASQGKFVKSQLPAGCGSLPVAPAKIDGGSDDGKALPATPPTGDGSVPVPPPGKLPIS